MFQKLFPYFFPVNFASKEEVPFFSQFTFSISITFTSSYFKLLVLDWLTDGKPKLYKSYAEGNILVRLTDVSCTPNQQTGRLIYNFSATATEIGDSTIDNYFKYKITSLTEIGNTAAPIREIGMHTHIDADTHTMRS